MDAEPRGILYLQSFFGSQIKNTPRKQCFLGGPDVKWPLRSREISQRQFLSLFINNKLWIFTVFFVGADQEEVHIGGDTEATVTAEFTFQLTAEVGCVIVKEFYLLSVWQRIFQIDKASRQHVKAFDLGQSLNMKQSVEFVDKLLLEFLKLFLAAEVDILLPEVHGKIAVGVAPSAVMLIE